MSKGRPKRKFVEKGDGVDFAAESGIGTIAFSVLQIMACQTRESQAGTTPHSLRELCAISSRVSVLSELLRTAAQKMGTLAFVIVNG